MDKFEYASVVVVWADSAWHVEDVVGPPGLDEPLVEVDDSYPRYLDLYNRMGQQGWRLWERVSQQSGGYRYTFERKIPA